MIHDPIADTLTRIRNALQREHRFVNVLYSKMILNVLTVFQKSGFIGKVIVSKDKRLVRVYLKYTDSREPLIKELKRESKPGRRRYVSADSLPVIKRGLGKCVISTSQGVMNAEEARQKNIGGELICSIS